VRLPLPWTVLATLPLIALALFMVWAAHDGGTPGSQSVSAVPSTETRTVSPAGPAAISPPAGGAALSAPSVAQAVATGGSTPTLPTPEAVRKFVAAYQKTRPMALSTLSDDLFKGQPRSDPWASRAENRIRSVLGNASGITRVRADCRHSICKVEIERDDSAHSWKIFPKDIGEGDSGLVVTGLVTSPSRSTFYLYSTTQAADYPRQLASQLGPLKASDLQ
jgi:hypothetical protein